ncbi:MAG: GIY-YIG nuclease family protein [Pseudomonadota bacterium]
MASDLATRIEQHGRGEVSSFTQKYNCHRLVWFEWFDDLNDAQRHERRMKNWNRQWKVKRIEERNPAWDDVSRRPFHTLTEGGPRLRGDSRST